MVFPGTRVILTDYWIFWYSAVKDLTGLAIKQLKISHLYKPVRSDFVKCPVVCDFDIWVEPSTENAKRMLQTIEDFGFPL